MANLPFGFASALRGLLPEKAKTSGSDLLTTQPETSSMGRIDADGFAAAAEQIRRGLPQPPAAPRPEMSDAQALAVLFGAMADPRAAGELGTAAWSDAVRRAEWTYRQSLAAYDAQVKTQRDSADALDARALAAQRSVGVSRAVSQGPPGSGSSRLAASVKGGSDPELQANDRAALGLVRSDLEADKISRETSLREYHSASERGFGEEMDSLRAWNRGVQRDRSALERQLIDQRAKTGKTTIPLTKLSAPLREGFARVERLTATLRDLRAEQARVRESSPKMAALIEDRILGLAAVRKTLTGALGRLGFSPPLASGEVPFRLASRGDELPPMNPFAGEIRGR